MATFSAQQLGRNVSAAKRAALDGPVFITSRGQVTHVLERIEAYRARQSQPKTLFDAIHPAWLDQAGLELDLPRRTEPPQAADFDQC